METFHAQSAGDACHSLIICFVYGDCCGPFLSTSTYRGTWVAPGYELEVVEEGEKIVKIVSLFFQYFHKYLCAKNQSNDSINKSTKNYPNCLPDFVGVGVYTVGLGPIASDLT